MASNLGLGRSTTRHGADPAAADVQADDLGLGAPSAALQVAFFASLVVALPSSSADRGVLPSRLKEKERSTSVPTFVSAVILSSLGLTFWLQGDHDRRFQGLLAKAPTPSRASRCLGKFFEGVILLLLGFGVGSSCRRVFTSSSSTSCPTPSCAPRGGRLRGVLWGRLGGPRRTGRRGRGGLFVALVALYELSMLLARVTLAQPHRQAEAEDSRCGATS